MEILIVGAGPAGTLTSLYSLKKGYKVSIFEEHSQAGIPQHCSGVISYNTLNNLKEFIDCDNLIINRVERAIFHFSNNKEIVFDKKNEAVIINREALDKALADAASRNGAKIFYNKRFNGNFEKNFDVIVGADGTLSTVAEKFNFPKIKDYVFTLKTYIKKPIEDENTVHLFFDSKKFLGFFAWLIPHSKDMAEVGVGTIDKSKLSDAFKEFLSELKPSFTYPSKGKLIPISSRSKIGKVLPYLKILLVGDAAGQTKPFTGGGMAYLLAASKLASLHLEDPLEYEKNWKKFIFKDYLIFLLAHKFFSYSPHLFSSIFSDVFNFFKLNKFISKYGNMDFPSKIVDSLF